MVGSRPVVEQRREVVGPTDDPWFEGDIVDVVAGEAL